MKESGLEGGQGSIACHRRNNRKTLRDFPKISKFFSRFKVKNNSTMSIKRRYEIPSKKLVHEF
jgi:hypothetical protein